MKTRFISNLILSGLLLTTSSGLHAETWTGAGTTDNWTGSGADANWEEGSAPADTGASLIFSGNTRLNPYNNSVTSVNGLTFAAGADAFTLDGNAFTLAGSLINASHHLQTIRNALTISSRTIDTGIGGVDLKSVSATSLNKIGYGELILSGGSVNELYIRNGKVVLDASNGLTLSGSLGFGHSSLSGANQSGSLEIKGHSSGTTWSPGNLSFLQSSGGNRIILNANGGAGITLDITGTLTRSITATTGQSTVNFDLSSSANNQVFVENFATSGASGTSGANGVLLYATVTTQPGASKLTGFAQANVSGATNELTRFVPTLDLATTGNINTQDYKTSGNLTLSSGDQINTLTITGSGSLAGSSLRPKALLMQEGAGDYTVATAYLGWVNNTLFIHQYSQAGNLMIDGNLFANSTVGTAPNNRLAKTGAGSVIFNTGRSAQYMEGATDIQEGRLQLDGSLGTTSIVYVRAGATLDGQGSIGGEAYLSGDGGATRYTPVHIYEGGTLDGTYSSADALSITGSLTLYDGSAFRVDLADSSFDALSVSNATPLENIVSLNGNLVLTLGFAPEANQQINLLTSSGGLITGQFTSINNNPFQAENQFTLNYGGTDYRFQIHYDDHLVYLNAMVIPEPSAYLLFGLVAAGFYATSRRRARA